MEILEWLGCDPVVIGSSMMWLYYAKTALGTYMFLTDADGTILVDATDNFPK